MEGASATADFRDEAITQDLLSSVKITTYLAMPLPAAFVPNPAVEVVLGSGPRIKAVGIGAFGAKVVQLLSRNVAGITCHELQHAPDHGHAQEIDAFLSSLTEADLLFLVLGVDDYSTGLAMAIGELACQRSKVWTVAVTQNTTKQYEQHIQGPRQWCHTLFLVSEQSLPQEPPLQAGDGLLGYALRQPISVITKLLTLVSGICIDFADVKAALQAGRVGWVGVGHASGPGRGAIAAKAAIERVKSEGASVQRAFGMLGSVHGSFELTMEDFDDAATIIHESVSSDANVVVGLIDEEQAGANVKVTVILVS